MAHSKVYSHVMASSDDIKNSGFDAALVALLSLVSEAYLAGDIAVDQITRLEYRCGPMGEESLEVHYTVED